MSVPAEGSKLVEFIKSAKAAGAEDRFLVALLRQNGWPERRIYAAFSSYYATAIGQPVPSRGSRAENARDAFLYLLAFVTLGIWTVAFVWLFYILIDHAFPSPLDYSDYGGSSFHEQVAGQLASLIVAFPIFILVSRAIVLQTRRHPESLDSGVRKWLTYVALVITSLCLLGDAVWFLQQFLMGDLTIRFAFKSLILFAVAGAVLWYYLGAVRQADAPPARDRIFGWTATAAAIVAVIAGFTGVGTPAYERSVQLDRQRIGDLRTLANRIQDTYLQTRRLPATLPRSTVGVRDPVSHRPYKYVPKTAPEYQLCATFDTVDDDRSGNDAWNHPAGESCFTLDATQSPG